MGGIYLYGVCGCEFKMLLKRIQDDVNEFWCVAKQITLKGEGACAAPKVVSILTTFRLCDEAAVTERHFGPLKTSPGFKPLLWLCFLQIFLVFWHHYGRLPLLKFHPPPLAKSATAPFFNFLTSLSLHVALKTCRRRSKVCENASK